MSKALLGFAHEIVVGELIAVRRSRGVSQVELAARLGKTQQFVSLVERGGRRISLVEFYAIARALGANPVDVFEAVVRVMPDRVEI